MAEPMTLAELIPALKAKGLTHVRTFGPLLTLDEWNPYGVCPGGPNYTEGREPYRGEIVEHEGKTYIRDYCEDNELRIQCKLVLGMWEIVKL